MALLRLGSLSGTDIMDDKLAAFAYEPRAILVPLIGDGVATYNAVLQSSALTARKAFLSSALETTQMRIVRDYAETLEPVVFTDYEGVSTTVRVIEFAANNRFLGVWDCSLTLLDAGT